MAKATSTSGKLFAQQRNNGEPDSAATRLSWDEIHSNAVAFSKRWEESHREKADAQPFITEFLEVFGVADAVKKGEREKPVKISGAHDKYIDFFWKDHIAIEMKSRQKLDGAYDQLKWYMEHIPDEDVPDLWMVCDFETFKLWRRSTGEIFTFALKDFRKHIRRFADIAGYTVEQLLDEQVEINVKGAERMAALHLELERHGYAGHDLEVYLVRLLFCLFAGDAGIFPKDKFFQYLYQSKEDGSDLSARIGELFEVLNMPPEIRETQTLLSDELKQFQYINGNLFSLLLPTARFDKKMRQTLIHCAREYDWQEISPAIFGAMFQGVMDKIRRRELGAHYTSEENIRKLIYPLFMEDLWNEFNRVKTDPAALEQFHEKIGSLKFLDPACGCGNFLIVTYQELRKLELEVLRMKIGTGKAPDIKSLLKVSVEQFYGIEYEDFPCQIAQTGMWLADHQMNMKVSDEFGKHFTRLPLAASATIVHGNALQINWEEIVPKEELSYILGNPPFVGASMMSAKQKSDAVAIFGKIKLSNSIDYVGAWYHKAAEYIQGTPIRVAFVATNSITQGEQVAPLWGKLFDKYGVHIDFGYRTFKWSNAAPKKAAVHCVIIGFSTGKCDTPRFIYGSDGARSKAKNVNAYLVDAPNVLIASRSKPICDAPTMYLGNKPSDGSHLILTAEEKNDLLAKEPQAAKLIKRYIGAVEFINGMERFCIWLKENSFADVKNCPSVLERIEKVRAFRLSSTAQPTVEKAETPHLFFFISQPTADYLLIPSTSSENRKYIPIGYVDKDTIASNANMIIPDATPCHFGILTSSVHMAWTRSVCGRLKSDYRYTGAIVYNNFPWPDATGEQETKIEKLAQDILDARTLYPDSTLADMYGENSMPFHPKLVKAHQTLDRAVMKLYGFTKGAPEPAIVAALMERYQQLTEGKI